MLVLKACIWSLQVVPLHALAVSARVLYSGSQFEKPEVACIVAILMKQHLQCLDNFNNVASKHSGNVGRIGATRAFELGVHFQKAVLS